MLDKGASVCPIITSLVSKSTHRTETGSSHQGSGEGGEWYRSGEGRREGRERREGGREGVVRGGGRESNEHKHTIVLHIHTSL